MNSSPRSGSLVVGVDGSWQSTQALSWAAQESHRTGRPIHLIHAFAPDYPSLGYGLGGDRSMLREQAEEQLREAAETIHIIDSSIEVTTGLSSGFPSAALVRASKEARLVVVGTRGQSLLAGTVLGSVSSQVAMHAHCPVIIVRGAQGEDVSQTHRILVGYDGSPQAQLALELAFDEAVVQDAQLVCVQAWWPGDVEEAAAARGHDWADYQREQQDAVRRLLKDRLNANPDVSFTHEVVKDNPAKILIERSHDADLVAVGARGNGGFQGLLLGSVSSAVLQKANCTIALIRERSAA
ncbi:MAG TPA: universal stress protein [Segeticoccus sp.]|uniref:universal stress protein n=1 Tax=Segeticoccus sp. TaxID=2706531 RepID=UPI002D80A22C|nr:universal stress protein [Segeticoccus sp.]HET8599712.1 universal stress protein [Segeticoccus sp.]